MLEIITAKDGCESAVYNGLSITGKYRPSADMERFVASMLVGRSKDDVYFLFGGALGLFPAEMARQGVPEVNIHIYEPVNELEAAMAARGHEKSLFRADTALSPVIERALKARQKTHLIALESYRRIFPAQYRSLEERYQKEFRAAVENIKVESYFSKVWFCNMVRNASLSLGGRFVLRKQAGDCPAAAFPVLVAASGPSLGSWLEEIRRCQDRYIILAVLSAAATLVKNGITPDLFIVSDAGPANKIHAYGLPESVPVLASVYAHSGLLSGLKNPVIYFDFEEELRDWMDESPAASFGLKKPSVTVDAGLAARRLFPKSPLVFCGFDLAFSMTEGAHCRGSALASFRDNGADRFGTVQGKRLGFLARKDLVMENGACTSGQFLLVRDLAGGLFGGSAYTAGGLALKGLEPVNGLAECAPAGEKKPGMDGIGEPAASWKGLIGGFLLNVRDGLEKCGPAICDRVFTRENIGGWDWRGHCRYFLRKFFGA